MGLLGCASKFCAADRVDRGDRATAAAMAPLSDAHKPIAVSGVGDEHAQDSAPIRQMQKCDAHPTAGWGLTAAYGREMLGTPLIPRQPREERCLDRRAA